MTDDLKQKEDAAWALLRDGFNGESLDKYRAAVGASIAAALADALAPVLERVARLENPLFGDPRARCSSILRGVDGSVLSLLCSLDAEHEGPHFNSRGGRVWPADAPKPPAPCATCGGARFVCDCAFPHPGYSCHRNWRGCPACSKPAASPEASAPAATQGIPQSGPGAPAALADALAPVLERVARLEKENAPMTVEDLADAVQDVLATLKQRQADGPAVTPAPCATCGGATWVCDVSVDGASYHRKPCPDCSKPAASPEGKKVEEPPGDAVNGPWEPPQPPSPAESEGKPDWADWMATNEYHQSLGAKWMCEAIVRKYAPDEREIVHAFARKWEDASFWRPTEPAPTAKPCPLKECSETAPHSHAPNTGWIRPDSWDYENNRPRETAPTATQGIPERMGRLRVVRVLETRYASASVEITMPSPQGMWPHARGTEFVRADLLSAAERRIAELEAQNAAMVRAMADVAETERHRTDTFAIGREAGVREAAYIPQKWQLAGVVSMSPGEAAREILALLANKPEVGT